MQECRRSELLAFCRRIVLEQLNQCIEIVLSRVQVVPVYDDSATDLVEYSVVHVVIVETEVVISMKTPEVAEHRMICHETLRLVSLPALISPQDWQQLWFTLNTRRLDSVPRVAVGFVHGRLLGCVCVLGTFIPNLKPDLKAQCATVGMIPAHPTCPFYYFYLPSDNRCIQPNYQEYKFTLSSHLTFDHNVRSSRMLSHMRKFPNQPKLLVLL